MSITAKPITAKDHQLLERIRELAQFLREGVTVRMVHTKVHAEFIDDMRLLGDWLFELGSDLLDRADELDNEDFADCPATENS
jgi:hypothetical protein